MSFQFENARSFNSNLDLWEVKKVESLTGLFKGATNFAGSLEGWKVEKVLDFTSMFEDAESFDSDVSGWKMKKVERMDKMFKGARSFNQNLDDWGKLDKVISMNEMFFNTASFNQTICWEKLDSELEMMYIFHYSGGCFDSDCINQDLRPYYACGPWPEYTYVETPVPTTAAIFTSFPVPAPTVDGPEYEGPDNLVATVPTSSPEEDTSNSGSIESAPIEPELEVGRAISGGGAGFSIPSWMPCVLTAAFSLLVSVM